MGGTGADFFTNFFPDPVGFSWVIARISSNSKMIHRILMNLVIFCLLIYTVQTGYLYFSGQDEPLVQIMNQSVSQDDAIIALPWAKNVLYYYGKWPVAIAPVDYLCICATNCTTLALNFDPDCELKTNTIQLVRQN